MSSEVRWMLSAAANISLLNISVTCTSAMSEIVVEGHSLLMRDNKLERATVRGIDGLSVFTITVIFLCGSLQWV